MFLVGSDTGRCPAGPQGGRQCSGGSPGRPEGAISRDASTADRRRGADAGGTLRGRKVSQGFLFSEVRDRWPIAGGIACAVEPEDLLALKTAGDVQIHPPTGGAWLSSSTSMRQARRWTRCAPSIWVVETGGSGRLEPLHARPQARTAPPAGRRTGAGWPSSPTGGRRARRAQLYLVPAEGGEARRLTDLEEGAGPAVVVAGRDAPGLRRPGAAGDGPGGDAAEEALGAAPAGGDPGPLQDGRDGLHAWTPLAHLFVAASRAPCGASAGPAGGGPDHVRRGGVPRPRPGRRTGPAWPTAATGTGGRITPSPTSGSPAPADRTPRRLTAGAGRAAGPPGRRTAPGSPSTPRTKTSRDWATRPCTSTRGRWPPAAASRRPPRGSRPGDDRSANLLRPPLVSPGPAWVADGASLLYAVDDAGSIALVRAGLERPSPRRGRRRALDHHPQPHPRWRGRSRSAPPTPAPRATSSCCAADGSAERRLTAVNGRLAEVGGPGPGRAPTFATPGGRTPSTAGSPAPPDRAPAPGRSCCTSTGARTASPATPSPSSAFCATSCPGGGGPCWPSIPAARAPTARTSPTASGAAGASLTSRSSSAPPTPWWRRGSRTPSAWPSPATPTAAT